MAHMLDQKLVEAFGIDLLPLEEQAAFLSEVGDAVFQTSLIQLFSQLTEEEQAPLEVFLASEPEPDVLLAHLLQNYAAFSSILEATVYSYKENAQKALAERDDEIKIIE